MKVTTVKALVSMLCCCVAACSHDSGFKKASPQVTAATNMQLAIEYMKLGNLVSSRDHIEQAINEDPSNPDVQTTAGLVYERLNDMRKAERAYSTGYRLGKKNPNIENTYAGFLCRTGKAVEGEKLFAAIATDPLYQTPEVALVNAGVCVRGTGDVVDAERYFNRALAIHPNLPEAMLQLGNIAFERGEAAQALDTVQRYLAVNPPTSEILWLGLRAQRKLGDSTATAGYARRIQTEFPTSEQAQMMRSGVER